MRDKTKAQNAPSLELRPANENPWYVLMTLYGDAYGKNRKVWNSWAAQVLTDEEKLAYEELGKVDELTKWETIRDEVELKFTYEFEKRNGPRARVPPIPDPNVSVRLSKLLITSHLELESYVFPRGFYLSRSLCKGDVDFEDSIFLRACSVRKTTFEEDVMFLEVHFRKGMDFSGTVGGEASFIASKFHGPASFYDATFLGDVSFTQTEFSELAIFLDSSFEKRSLFEFARFRGRAKFHDVAFGKLGSEEVNFPSFLDCVFEKPTSFSQVRFLNAYPNFSGAILHEQTSFTARRTPTESEVEANRNLEGAVYWPDQTLQDPEMAKKSCATIRHILSQQGLPEEEHSFYRKEMYFAGQIGSIGQRLPYLLFGLFSDYGYSILRPTLWLAGLWALGFVAFWGYLAGCCVPAPLDVVDRPMGTAMGLSFSNLFPLFGFGRTFLAAELAGLPAVLKVISGFQTVFSLPLLFFLGLGLRQRFRLR